MWVAENRNAQAIEEAVFYGSNINVEKRYVEDAKKNPGRTGVLRND